MSQGVVLYCSARSLGSAAVQPVLRLDPGPREVGTRPPGPQALSRRCRDGGWGSRRRTPGGRASAAASVRSRKLLGPHPRLRASARRHSPGVFRLDERRGARRHSSGRDPPPEHAPALSGPPAALQPAALVSGGALKPVSAPPGASRRGRHLEHFFTGSAGPLCEGGTPASHQIAPADLSTGPRDAGEPCIAFLAPLDRGS
ncbi:hypothetical protein NDU88_004029 [Pleurodeles waltl]|uniref:Uncharacterized protein n=1 Tax=Pleurodeles waltl TaxID=8319 RepID=A0AAV7VFX2_PLEWA|nr:hypothetical protein NDU88_004029 [Pleurodeles waltl]